jgi:hypothetical protein
VPSAWCRVLCWCLAEAACRAARPGLKSLGRFEDLEAWQLANEVKKKVYAYLDISKLRKVSQVLRTNH